MVELSQEASKSLAQLRQWLKWRNLLLAALLPGGLLVGWVTNVFDIRWLLLAYISAWLVCFVIVRQRVRYWPCPFCRKPVLKKGPFQPFDFTSKCLHCHRNLKPSSV